MISLEKKFKSINFLTHLEEANNLVTAGVSTGVTWWGAPAIKIEGYEGDIAVKDIANRLLQVGKEKSKTGNITLPERIAAIQLIQKLKLIFTQVDLQKKANEFSLIDRIFIWFQDHNPFNTIRSEIEEFGEISFLTYSSKGFISEFGGELTEDDQIPGAKFHPDAEGETANGMIARYSSLQQKYSESLEKQAQKNG